MPALKLRSPVAFSGAFLLLAIAFTAYFDITVRTNQSAAVTRFGELMEIGALKRAAPHGERAILLAIKSGSTPNELAPLKARVADAQLARKNHIRAADLLQDVLIANWGQKRPVIERLGLEDKLARAYLKADELEKSAAIYASFLDLAGDAAASAEAVESDARERAYAGRLAEAGGAFLRVVHHAEPHEIEGATPEHILASAGQFADLGGYYAMQPGNEYAAAGLLATAYEARKRVLGGDHQDTVQLTLILGPLFEKMGRLEDAEDLYLDAFHAQERSKGANSPDLSLYIKLLAGVYERQERFTEAQALYEHLRGLFRDAFGAQRYAVNRAFDRREYFNRPVSQHFPLEANYAPTDLVSAASYFVPTAKGPNIDEMKLRLAADENADGREASLPARLAQLISLCRSESGEKISLRSGFRSFETQAILHERNARRGTVTPPGVSEHQTGLAADINVNNRFMRQSDRTFQCFEENAYRYGFMLSYPPGNDYLPGDDTYEPWHWRYVGVQTAQLYREAGPRNQPQEFLAALPCYQERASTGLFPTAGEPDICLKAPSDKVAQNGRANQPESTPARFQPLGENADTARILNDHSKIAAER